MANYTIHYTKPAATAFSFGYAASDERPSLTEAEARAADLREAGFEVRVVPSGLPEAATHWVSIEQPDGWVLGPAGPWLELHGAATRRVLGAGRTWRVRRADGSLAWEGAACEMPATEPEASRDKS